jgi:hypothetical protein
MKPVWFHGDDVFVGGLLIAAGIYAFAYHYFHPDKISPKISSKQFRWLCVIMIIGGAFVAFSRVIFRD